MRFPGQYYDGETGLYYNLWRYYEPRTGSYLREDPIEITAILINHQIIKGLFDDYDKNQSVSYHYAYLKQFDENNYRYRNYKEHLLSTMLQNPFMLNKYIYSYSRPINYFDSKGLFSMCNFSCNMFWGNLICTPVGIFMGAVGAWSGVGAASGLLYVVLCRAAVWAACLVHCDDPCAKGNPFY